MSSSPSNKFAKPTAPRFSERKRLQEACMKEDCHVCRDSKTLSVQKLSYRLVNWRHNNIVFGRNYLIPNETEIARWFGNSRVRNVCQHDACCSYGHLQNEVWQLRCLKCTYGSWCVCLDLYARPNLCSMRGILGLCFFGFLISVLVVLCFGLTPMLLQSPTSPLIFCSFIAQPNLKYKL